MVKIRLEKMSCAQVQVPESLTDFGGVGWWDRARVEKSSVAEVDDSYRVQADMPAMVTRHHHVFGLEVAMGNVLRMEVRYSARNISKETSDTMRLVKSR
jgi:hypothetical protein